jgi:hypothetical protein
MKSVSTGLVLFTHYGDSEYLSYTLRQATRSNPRMRRVLVGDEKNRETASRAGWEHVMFRHLVSAKRDQFNARFRWVQGPKHQPVKGGQDWLRFVFERFYCLETFVLESGAKHFWHFDSDTMIVHDLERYTGQILSMDVECTTLCHDYCPSGLITTSFLKSYCDGIIRIFGDEDFLAEKQRLYDNVNSAEAYTEMPAFCDHRISAHSKTVHLASAFAADGVWFDDCICHGDSFDTVSPSEMRRKLKALRAIDAKIVCRKEGVDYEFATINCSWVPLRVFEWIGLACEGRLGPEDASLAQYIQVPKKTRLVQAYKRLVKRFR